MSKKIKVRETVRSVRDALSELLTRTYSTAPRQFSEIAQELTKLSTELAYASQDAAEVATTAKGEDGNPLEQPGYQSRWPSGAFKSDMRR